MADAENTAGSPADSTAGAAGDSANQSAVATEAAPAVDVHEAQLPQVTDSGIKSSGGQIDILLDTTMTISACMGNAEMQIRDLLQLGPGSVLKLDRQVGEPVDLFLRGVKFATGQLVVVMGDRLGVKIKEIIASQEPPHA